MQGGCVAVSTCNIHTCVCIHYINTSYKSLVVLVGRLVIAAASISKTLAVFPIFLGGGEGGGERGVVFPGVMECCDI